MPADATDLLLLAAAALLAFAFTVVPVLPGALFPLLALVAVGALDGWGTVPVVAWVALVVLLLLYLLADNVAQLLGVQRLGGSRRAMAYGTVGVVLGPVALAPVLGPLALVLGPPVGAVAGTILGERSSARRAGAGTPSANHYRRLGTGALVAYVVGTAAKLVIVAIQVGILAWVVLR